MEMTELDKAFQEIKVDNLEAIDYEINDLEKQIDRLKARRASMMIGDLDFIGKYFRVTNFGSSYVFYVRAEKVVANKTGATVLGETYIVLDIDRQISVEYLKRGEHQYDLNPDIHSNVYEEIPEEEFVSEVEEVLGRLNKEITKSRK